MDTLFVYDLTRDPIFDPATQHVLPFPNTHLTLPYKVVYKHVAYDTFFTMAQEVLHTNSIAPILIMVELTNLLSEHTLHTFLKSLEITSTFPFIVSNTGIPIRRLLNASTFNFMLLEQIFQYKKKMGDSAFTYTGEKFTPSPMLLVNTFTNTAMFLGTPVNLEMISNLRIQRPYISYRQAFDPILRGRLFEFRKSGINQLHFIIYIF